MVRVTGAKIAQMHETWHNNTSVYTDHF